jgi:NAD(P)-dependent dehydrogenase (short-subunit alcohol dehydrogenase family)
MSGIDGLRGKKCFITGAASGIGRATASAAGARGAVLFLTDIDAQGLAAAVAEIRGAGGTVASQRTLDIADFEAVTWRASADLCAANRHLARRGDSTGAARTR